MPTPSAKDLRRYRENWQEEIDSAARYRAMADGERDTGRACSRELAERELETERSEIDLEPEDEREELELLYRAKGLDPEEARTLSTEIISRPEAALDVLAREELGLDPEELGGSPWTAAGTSFVLFAFGAIIPLVPFFVARGTAAVLWSVGLSAVALFGIGAAITLFTGRGVLRTGLRQLILGLGAAAVTYGIGRLVGVAVGG